MPTEYIRHFGMTESPFVRNHDPKWLYLSTQHKEAVIKARWTIEEHGGLALIRGDVGMGKSFLVEYLMTVWPSQFGWHCAKLQNTGTITTARALLSETLAAFGLEPGSSAHEMATRLESWLLEQVYEQNQTIVLFIDEAQSIDSKAMPVLRDLLNLETRERILLQIVLSAQTNIDKKLSYYPALLSRIASVSTLEPLTAEETDAMILHRFRRAGCADPIRLCPVETMRAIYLYSGGVPRDIIVVTEAAMKEAFLRDSDRLLPEHVEQAVRDLAGRRPRFAKAA
ncbi:MAG TPA: AAA family ATPase [Chthonomonadales bacterium]|nr:AAA family ATPase [Chthonomonadales bacterium]